MLPTRMKGFIDPITLGFIVALIGTATVLALDEPAAEPTFAPNTAEVQATMQQTVEQRDG